MTDKKPFEKESTTKISFPELMELIGTCCDYKFCIIDDTIDEELMKLAASQGIDLNGFKHVIETSGIQHSENRHGKQSKDREPLSLEDYLLVPFIIRNRDKVSISTSKSKRHEMGIVVYEKLIGSNYYYVEEIRTGKKSLAFQTLYNKDNKKPLYRGVVGVIAEGASFRPPLYVLIINSFFIPFPRPTACKITTFPQTRKRDGENSFGAFSFTSCYNCGSCSPHVPLNSQTRQVDEGSVWWWWD